VGFLGGFTTFSTLTWQTYEFFAARDAAAAMLNVVGSVVVGMAAVYAGVGLARLIE
jgi:CrcB protein